MSDTLYNRMSSELSKLGLDWQMDYGGDGVIVYRVSDDENIPIDTLPKQVQIWLNAADTICQHNNNGLTCDDCERLAQNSATQQYPV